MFADLGSGRMEAAALTPRTGIVFLKVIAALGTILVVLPFVLLLGGYITRQFHAPVNADSLHVSVGVAAGSSFVGDGMGECLQRSDSTWRCEVGDQGGSGSHTYAVITDPDSSCWTATLAVDGGEADPPRTLSSCVRHFEEGWWGVLIG
jgi:hypothetical protein